MSATAEGDFRSRVSAYGDFAERVGPEAKSTGTVIDVLSEMARDAQEQLDDLPEPFEDLFDYVRRNRISLKRRDKDAVRGLLEKLKTAFEFIKDDVEQNIWSLLDEEDMDPISLEYVHSLIKRSIDGYLNFLEDPFVSEDRKEMKSDSFRYLVGFYYGFDRLQFLVQNNEIDDSEKEAINKFETEIEESNMFVRKEEEQPKIEASII